MPFLTDRESLLSPRRVRQQQYLHRLALVLGGFFIIFSIFWIISFCVNYKYRYIEPSILACKSPKYDYNLLAIRWTPTFCFTKKCVNSTENWDIHGLWPSWTNGSEGPEFCCRTWGFTKTDLTPILPDLDEDWPNQLSNRDKDSLWKHEWDKHGTCSTLAHSGGLINYFNTTITLFKKYPIQSWLSENNIVPTPLTGPAYTLEQIHNATSSKLGKRISIRCITKKGKQLIDSIYLCFEPSSMVPVDCPPDACRKTRLILPQAH